MFFREMNRTGYMILFAVVALTIVGSVHYYLWMRLVRDAALPSPWRQIGTGLVIFLGVSLPAIMVISRSVPLGSATWFAYIPYVWMGMMMLFFFLFAAVDIVRGVLMGAHKITASFEPADPGRRQLVGRLVAGGAVLTVGTLTAVSVFNAVKTAVVRRVRVALPGLPRSLDGFRIVQISDLHLGLTRAGDWLSEVVSQVNGLDPDLIAVTGDLVDGSVEQIGEEVKPISGLRAKRGVYFVTGNHEYYSGVEEWLPFIESMGMNVLRNERVQVGDGDEYFYLAGVDDDRSEGMAKGHGPNFARALDGRREGVPTVLLAHQPSAVSRAAQKGVDLILSGHTHGGQIWPFSYLVRLQQPYVKGMYRHDERTRVYVNQGTGLWGPPMRLGTESEITEIILELA